jgi:class 3 adenylate cyclase
MGLRVDERWSSAGARSRARVTGPARTRDNAGVAQHREERRVVSVLFADLVGSTTLAEQLDAEEVKLVVGEAVRRVVTEVERFGGHVKDIAGDGVLAFFGAPQASEDDPERAVCAGLQIADELGRYGREVEDAFDVDGFGVRVGIATGPVVVGLVGGGTRVEYGAFGDTVNVAARLQEHAVPSTVLVDEETQRLAAGAFEWGDAQELRLKGKSELVTAFDARRELAGAARRPASETRLVGREPELAAARELADGVRAGRGGVLFLVGEPGIGKTRLLSGLRDELDEATWLEGRCFSYGESLPYWPFRELLREWLGLTLDDAELRARGGCSASASSRSTRISAGCWGSVSSPSSRNGSRSSRPRPCATGRSRSWRRSSAGSPRAGRSWSRSRTCTGPIRPPRSWSRRCSPRPRTRPCCSPSRRAASATPPPGG